MYLLTYTIVCISFTVIALVHSIPTPGSLDQTTDKISIYFKNQWSDRIPVDALTIVNKPIPFVVIHHTLEPKSCNTNKDCIHAMKDLQNLHMDKRKWWDIGYNFGVGGDGVVYEARGWEVQGAHALNFNNISIGIVLIGDWTKNTPSDEQLAATKLLMKIGVKQGYLSEKYKIIGHRQVVKTKCPGEALFDEIKKWPQYSQIPSNMKEVAEVLKKYNYNDLTVI